eukprot:Skav224428  [mRNA]  locus=scaffold657:595185:599741:+ [translate_table: standard]
MSVDAKQVLSASLIYSYVLAGMVFVGGLIGFFKAKSKASLIASSCVALAILALDYVTLEVNSVYGQSFQVALSISLTFMFRGKWQASGKELEESLTGAPKKKFMPFGLLTYMCLLSVVLTSCSLYYIDNAVH